MEPDQTRLRERLAGLVGFATVNPPGAEEQAAHWLGKELASVGCEVDFQTVSDGRLNVIGRIANGAGPHLAFNSHLDVVPAGDGWSADPFTLRERDGRLIGRGACDAKGSIASMVEAMRLLNADRSQWSGTLTGVFVSDEEVGSTGAKAFATRAGAPDRIVVGEPTDLVTISAHKGCLRPRIVVIGRSAHSGTPELGDNAVVKAARLVDRFAAEDARLRKLTHPLIGPASLSVTRLNGGIGDNIIPPSCEIVIDRRMLPGESAETVLPEIEQILAQARTNGIETRITGFSSTAGPSETPADDPIVAAAVAASRAHGIEPPGPAGFLGGCDLVHFQRVGIRGVVIGPGSLAQAHKPDEWVLADDLAKASLVYRDLALGYFRS